MKTKHTRTKPANEIRATTTPAPEWLKVKEACDYSRLSKGVLYDLMNAGHIRNVSLRKRGQIKGTRLVSFDSLRGFLEKRATGGSTKPAV